MKQFTIIYTYPDDNRIGSLVVKAQHQDDSFTVAAKTLVGAGLNEVDMIVSIPGLITNNRWMGPAAEGWKTCNVGDYLKSMETNNEPN